MKRTILAAMAASLLSMDGLTAQAASSPSFFLTSGEFGAGGSLLSAGYDLDGSFGCGVVAGRGTSTSFELTGGFVATLETSASGRPWATGVRPLYAARNGAAALTVHGTELNLGLAATVKVGGKVAAVTSRSRDAIQTALPRDVAPGWQTVEVTAGGATTVLPRAIGVLPMIEVERPAVPDEPFRITSRGTQGDRVMWAVSARRFPVPIPLAPFGHGFELDPGFMLLLGVTTVTDPLGVFELPVPGVPWMSPLHVQGLVLSDNVAYRPGAFTNVIDF